MAPRRKSAAAASSAASAEAAEQVPNTNEASASTQATSTEATASDEAAASGSIPSSASEHRSSEPDVSEDEDASPMEIDDADDDAPPSEASEEVNSLNELLANFRLSDEEDEDFEVGGVDDPTKDDLQNLLSRYQGRLKRRAKMVGVIHARFSGTVRQIRQIRLERSVLEDAVKKVTVMKEDMLAVLTQQCDSLRKDIDSLQLSIRQGYDEDTESSAERGTPAEEVLPVKFSVKWDKNDPEHCALHRVFGEEYIPLVEGTKTVDYSRVKKRTFKDSPVLDLNVSSLPVEDMVKEVATRIVKFRDDFERWCRWHLSDDLMDKMAWDYMPSALSKVGLAKDYQELIKELPIEERTWKQVVVCLNKALKTELLEAHLADEVLTARPKVGETFLAFTQRLIPLVEAAKFPDDGCSVLIKALGNHLSDVGFQATIKEYGSFDEVKSIKKYL
ncbi:hypothetical protein BGZ72_002774, partial [Mortierella alpina]